MGISARKSEDVLRTETILSKITEYDIFKHYCSNFKEVGRRFKSDLRKSDHSNVFIVLLKGRLRYKDFGHSEHTFDCFAYVMAKLGLSFTSALEQISMDFGLGLTGETCIPIAKTYGKEKFESIEERIPADIKFRTRKWSLEDKKFWEQFGINKETLLKFKVRPIDYFWINGNRTKCKTITYVFELQGFFKIYSPYGDEASKWFSNCTSDIIQGYEQLEASGDILFLTSSLKDVMSLFVFGYPAIALQSEMMVPSEELVKNLKARFRKIIVLYDNDFHKSKNNGQLMAHKICDKYSLDNLCIPSEFKSKDVSDFIKIFGFNIVQTFIKKSLYEFTISYRSGDEGKN